MTRQVELTSLRSFQLFKSLFLGQRVNLASLRSFQIVKGSLASATRRFSDTVLAFIDMRDLLFSQETLLILPLGSPSYKMVGGQ